MLHAYLLLHREWFWWKTRLVLSVEVIPHILSSIYPSSLDFDRLEPFICIKYELLSFFAAVKVAKLSRDIFAEFFAWTRLSVGVEVLGQAVVDDDKGAALLVVINYYRLSTLWANLEVCFNIGAATMTKLTRQLIFHIKVNWNEIQKWFPISLQFGFCHAFRLPRILRPQVRLYISCDVLRVKYTLCSCVSFFG